MTAIALKKDIALSQPQAKSVPKGNFAALITPFNKSENVVQTGVPTIQPVAGGTGINFGSGNYYSLPEGVIKDSGGAGNWIGACYSIDVGIILQGSASDQSMFQFGWDASSSYWSFILSIHNGNIELYTGTTYTLVTAPVVNKLYSIRLTYSDFSPYTYKVWVNGVNVLSATGYQQGMATHAMFIGSGFWGVCSSLKLQYLAIQTGAAANLSDAYSRSVSTNPWQIFQSPRRAITYAPPVQLSAPRRSKRTSQPTALTQASSTFKPSRAAFIFNAVDLCNVNGGGLPTNTSLPPRVVTPYGIAIQSPNNLSSSGAVYAKFKRIEDTTNKVTFAIEIRLSTSTGSYIFLSQANSYTQGWSLAYDGSQLWVEKSNMSLPGLFIGSGWYRIIASHESSSGVYYLCAKNLDTGEITSVTGSNTSTVSTYPASFSVGGTSNYGSSPSDITVAYMDNVFKPYNEMAWFLDNPWQIFQDKVVSANTYVQTLTPIPDIPVRGAPYRVRKINWNHPLLATIEDVFVPTENGHVRYSRNPAKLKDRTLVGAGTLSQRTSHRGCFTKFNSVREEWPKNGAYWTNSATLILEYIPSLTTDSYTALGGVAGYYDDGLNFSLYDTYPRDQNVNLYGSIGGVTVNLAMTGKVGIYNNFLAGVYDGSTLTFYVNGSTSSTPASGSIRNSATGLVLGSVQNNFNGGIGLAFFSSKATPLDVIRELERNPWQVFDDKVKIATNNPPYLLASAPRRSKLTTQPKQPTTIDWSNPITRGLYTATVPRLGDVVNQTSEIQDANVLKTSHIYGNVIGQTTFDTFAPGVRLSNKNLTARTELIFQYAFSRGSYGAWFKSNYPAQESIRGEYSDTEVSWYIHGSAYGNVANPYQGQTAASLLNRPCVLILTWDKDKNSGYGRCFDNGREVPRTAGFALTGVCARSNMTPPIYGGPDQGQNYIYLFAAWDRSLDDAEIASLSANPWQIFQDRTIPGFYATTLPVTNVSLQILSPLSDITAGSWLTTGSSLHEVLDELVADPADYVYTASASYCEIKLQPGSLPISKSGHVLNYQVLPGSGNLLVQLKQGSTIIASWNHTVTGATQDFSQTLTGPQADALTDYTDLRVGLTSS